MNATIAQTRRFHAEPAADQQSVEGLSRFGAESSAAATIAHGVTRDRTIWSEGQPRSLDYLRHAQAKSGRRPMELVREYWRLHRGQGRLTLPEYVQYGVYDTAVHDPEAQARFLTNTLHWPITRQCCDMTWQATTEDKWLCGHILERSDIRIPETLAVIDTSNRQYPGTRHIATVDALRDFMTSADTLPLFGKANRIICGFGAFFAEAADSRAVHLRGQGPVDYETFLSQFIGDTPYLLQRLETNHPFFERFTESLATIRVCILLDARGVTIPFAVLKLPARGNIVDSFWRTGNLACQLDVATGEILKARSKDRLGTTDHAHHPETGNALVGETLPMWDEVVELARNCAPIFRPLRYQSMDIAITENGPVLIEINTGGGFDLPQLASGEGFLTDEVRRFFHDCGYTGA